MDASDSSATVEQLESLVRDLTTEVRRLRQAVDDLREEVFAEFPQRRRDSPESVAEPAATPPLRLTSMPLDVRDPDFGRKINAIEGTTALPESPRATTLNEFVARLTREPPADQISCDDWSDGRTAAPGVVVQVDDDLFDWFADNFEAEYEAPGGVYVLAGDNGGEFVLWCNGAEIFLRQLTAAEEQEFAELMRIEEEKAALKREQFREREALQQGSLW